MPKVGETFNPYRVFYGIFIPEALVGYQQISDKAKLCYGVLCRFSGENGHCFPGQDKIGEVLRVGERQVRHYLSELVDDGWIRAKRRGLGQTNTYEFLWHHAFTDRTETSSLTGEQPAGLSGGQPAGLSGGQSSGPLKEEESHSKRVTGRESETPKDLEVDDTLKQNQNLKTPKVARDARARRVQPLDTAELYLDDPIETFLQDAGRRERRLRYKFDRRKDESFIEALRRMDSQEFRAAFLEYLKASDEWLTKEGWPLRNFVKHWELYDRSMDDVPDHVAVGQEMGLDLSDTGSEVPEQPPVAGAPPEPDFEVLDWAPHQFAEYWNSVAGLPQVKWHDMHDRKGGVKAFADPEFRRHFKTACAIAVKLHATRGEQVAWLGFRWLLKYPEDSSANWWKLISGEFAWMNKAGAGKPVQMTGDQAAEEVRQLMEQEEKARNETNS